MTFSYTDATFEDLDQRAVEKLIFEQAEGQFILRTHVFIERLLDTAIQRNVRYPERLNAKDRLSFELKVDLARALGVLPERMVSAIRALNGLRNRVVHIDDFRPSLAELRRLRLDWQPIQVKNAATYKLGKPTSWPFDFRTRLRIQDLLSRLTPSCLTTTQLIEALSTSLWPRSRVSERTL
jgi:hypothetical protein